MSIDRNATSNETRDAALEALMSRHLTEQLDGQLGRASERFQAELDRGGLARHRQDHARRALWSWAASLTAVAASIAVVAAVARFDPPPHDARPSAAKTSNRPATSGANDDPTLIASTAPSNEPIERALWWRTVDQGTVYIDDTPMRQLLRQQVEELKYRAPDGTESVQVNVPRQEVMLVAYNKY